ncbi:MULTISPECIES: hypothetical protein [unclassified Oceanobacillus]|uniref:hypothetical protein n=1 Tax=unclassified Oceanobacillus TaxID=2630292 RepID=UPI001BE8D1F0|nr:MULTISPECIES: hypothetical protein [unclassified Oceanobacillus]MBT2599079.1 hypothetical protein [Oceanobacillus sp. ISL-74]MBT2651997.1 hypothetical protein [Oceanobacillus sp. ISL-73]
MKLTVTELYNLSDGLKNILDKELPTSVAFSIQRNFKKVGDELTPSNEVRKNIIEKYKEKDNGDGSFNIKKDKVELCKKEVNELMEQEVDIDLKRIKLSDLGESIKPRTLGLLEPIIKEEEA